MTFCVFRCYAWTAVYNLQYTVDVDHVLRRSFTVGSSRVFWRVITHRCTVAIQQSASPTYRVWDTRLIGLVSYHIPHPCHISLPIMICRTPHPYRIPQTHAYSTPRKHPAHIPTPLRPHRDRTYTVYHRPIPYKLIKLRPTNVNMVAYISTTTYLYTH